MKYEERNETIEIPKGVGTEGFIRAVRGILQLGRVQEIHITATGKVAYKYFQREGDTEGPLDIDFSSLMPYAVARNGHIEEVLPTASNPAVVLGQMFGMATRDHMYPVAWVGGEGSQVWAWFETTGLHEPLREELYGLPFMKDPMVGDEVLLLCTAYSRRSPFTETVRSYKLLIPRIP